MKTTSSARRFVRITIIIRVALLAALLGTEIVLGGAFVARVGQTTGTPTQAYSVPNISLGDMLAGAR